MNFLKLKFCNYLFMKAIKFQPKLILGKFRLFIEQNWQVGLEDISCLNEGIYFVWITTEKGMVVNKVVKI